MEAKWVKRMALRIAKPDHEYFKPHRKQHHEFRGMKTTLDPINVLPFLAIDFKSRFLLIHERNKAKATT